MSTLDQETPPIETGAATRLGLNASTLYSRMKKLGIRRSASTARRLRKALLLAVPMLLGAACAAIQEDTQRMLVAAGFQARPADTAELQEDLRSIPPNRLVSRTKGGNVVYMYADPDHCHCVYVGGSREYSEYERRRLEREMAPPAGAAGGAP